MIDTKWKRLAPPSVDRAMGVAQADVYQMMAYAQLYGWDRLLLVYPHHGGFPQPVIVRNRVARPGGDVLLTIGTLYLSSHGSARAGLSELLSPDGTAHRVKDGGAGCGSGRDGG